MFSALGQQLSPHLLVQKQQRVELLVIHLGPAAHAGLDDFLEPCSAMARRVHLLASTGDGPASVDRFQTNHHAREIFGDGHINFALSSFIVRRPVFS